MCSDTWGDKVVKNKKLDVRITEYEYHQLAQEAKRRGMSKSDLIRSFIAKLPDPIIEN